MTDALRLTLHPPHGGMEAGGMQLAGRKMGGGRKKKAKGGKSALVVEEKGGGREGRRVMGRGKLTLQNGSLMGAGPRLSGFPSSLFPAQFGFTN